MTRLFGTDGVRGKAGTELTALLAFRLGMAGAAVLAKESGKKRPSMLIGADTRISSDMLVAALTAGICAVGVDVYNAGVVPAPAVAFLIKKYGLSAGVIVSASHNAFGDNGIKFYNGDGHKLTDEMEDKIAALMPGLDSIVQPTGADVGHLLKTTDSVGDYVEFLKKCVSDVSLSGLKIALDCANGATYQSARRVFEELDAIVDVIGDTPDGININENCGSTHIETLVDFVKLGDYDMGFAFDGDGDRCFAVDEHGNVVDGDMLMSIIGTHWKQQGLLAKNTIIATVMSNLGFFKEVEANGITAEQVKVGDRYVLERMIEGGFSLGGEQSGHIICLDHHTTGDGILTALLVAQIVIQSGRRLSKLNTMKRMPQALVNAKIKNEAKEAVLADESIKAEIAALTQRFDGNGRVLIRPSGTEPLIRVMIEGEDIEEITNEAKRIADLMEAIAK